MHVRKTDIFIQCFEINIGLVVVQLPSAHNHICGMCETKI